jgi:hypothetical protein
MITHYSCHWVRTMRESLLLRINSIQEWTLMRHLHIGIHPNSVEPIQFSNSIMVEMRIIGNPTLAKLIRMGFHSLISLGPKAREAQPTMTQEKLNRRWPFESSFYSETPAKSATASTPTALCLFPATPFFRENLLPRNKLAGMRSHFTAILSFFF